MISATKIAPQTGTTELGKLINKPEMAVANTAFTINRTKKITIINSDCERRPTTSPVKAPIERARLRFEAQIAPASCTPAKKIVPKITHKNAGTQPQMTAIAGPIIGAAPATEVKWWPQRTYLLVGTKSTPSSNSCAGVRKLGSSL